MTAPGSSCDPSLEPRSYPSAPKSKIPTILTPDNASDSQQKLGISDLEDIRAESDAIPSQDAVEQLQKWNYPRSNMWRVFATFWSFLIVGMNDGSYGVSALYPG